MIKAVLLDLDNTLLRNPDAAFAAQYLSLTDQYFEQRWQFPNISKIILKTIRAMGTPHPPHKTNAEVAIEIIAHAIELPFEEVRQAFDDFYQSVYPQLQSCVELFGEIVTDLVHHLREQGYALVIATNPIYPAEAVRQRLNWAGVPDDFKFYALVTHAENMHFAKPDPAYYAEIVARVGVEPDEAIMIGDSLKNDIEPARCAGLHTYTIDTTHPETSLKTFYTRYASKEKLDSLPTNLLVPAMIEPELRGNIGALFGTLSGVQSHYWNQHPDPNEWSPIQILCHLLESEKQVQRPRLERILAENNPFLVSPPPPAGPNEALPCNPDGMQVAMQFTDSRIQTIQWLQNLQPTDWKRPARHSIFGPTNLLEMAHFTAQHDRLHINQLCQTIGKCE